MSRDETAFLIRGQALDNIARDTARALREAGAAHVIAVMDERQGEADTAPFGKISLTGAVLKELGLSGLPSDWGWFCGDVWLYAARLRLPGFARYCLIESDVSFAGRAAARFVEALRQEPADIMAARLGRIPGKGPKYSRGLSALGLDPNWGCIFPVTCISGPAVDAMLALRRHSLARGNARKINDEAVLAGVAQSGAFSWRSLYEILPDLFTPEDFVTNPPHLAEAMSRKNRDRVLHPVVPLRRVLERIPIGEKGYTRHRLRRILREATQTEKRQILSALKAAEAPLP